MRRPTRYNAADKPLKDSYARVMWDENNLYFLVYAATDKRPAIRRTPPPLWCAL